MKKPLDLRRLDILAQRKSLTPNQLRRKRQLQRGYEGERSFAEALKKYNDKQWKIMADINLKTAMGFVQIDFLILSGCYIYLIEVKNYSFDCYFKNNRWYFSNHKDIANNPSHQLQNAKLHLQSIFDQSDLTPIIQPYLIFTNPNQQVNIINEPEETIITSQQIDLLLSSIPINSNPQLIKKYTKQIKKFLNPEAELFFMKEIGDLSQVQQGVYCSFCQKFGLKQSHRHLFCPHCEHYETKSHYICQLTHDFCLLFLKPAFTSQDIAAFSQNFFTRRQISAQIANKFPKIKKGRYTSYSNPYLY